MAKNNLFSSLTSMTDELKKSTEDMNKETVEYHGSVLSELQNIAFQLNDIRVLLRINNNALIELVDHIVK